MASANAARVRASSAGASDSVAPQPGDSVACWFDAFLSRRLIEAGLPTLGVLVGHIHRTGERWWYPVRGLGETKAQRVVEWLGAQEACTGWVLQALTVQQAPASVLPGLQRQSATTTRSAMLPHWLWGSAAEPGHEDAKGRALA